MTFWRKKCRPPRDIPAAETEGRQEAEQALAKAHQALARNREARGEIGAATERLRREREANHFAPAIADAIRRGIR